MFLKKRKKARTQTVTFWRYLKRTAEKKLKERRKDGALWCYLKWCFGSWNCLEKIESIKEAKWCILALFETVFGSWNCLENVAKFYK